MKKILVSGAGSLLGQGIIKTIKSSAKKYEIYGADYIKDSVGLYWVKKGYLLPDILKSKQNEIKVADANSLKDSLDKITLTMRVEANEEDSLYGAITQKQVSDLLKAQGHNILNENIVTGEIKNIGEFDITIRIYEEISSTIKISIEKK